MLSGLEYGRYQVLLLKEQIGQHADTSISCLSYSLPVILSKSDQTLQLSETSGNTWILYTF